MRTNECFWWSIFPPLSDYQELKGWALFLKALKCSQIGIYHVKAYIDAISSIRVKHVLLSMWCGPLFGCMRCSHKGQCTFFVYCHSNKNKVTNFIIIFFFIFPFIGYQLQHENNLCNINVSIYIIRLLFGMFAVLFRLSSWELGSQAMVSSFTSVMPIKTDYELWMPIILSFRVQGDSTEGRFLFQIRSDMK